MNKALFLDRDGVLNRKAQPREYIKNPEELIWNNWAQELIICAKDLGYIICVITNQQWIGKWLYTLDNVLTIHEYMQSDLDRIGTRIDGFYVCPHLADDACSCRKPEPWLLLQAIQDFDIDISQSFFIGDSETDMQAGKKVGMETIKIESDNLGQFILYIESLLLRS